MMKRILTLLWAVTLSSAAAADCCPKPFDYSFYLKVGTGISFSESAKVSAPTPTWTPAEQGYDAKLGNRAIGDFRIGCEFMQLVDLEASVSTRCTFKYRKFQTPVGGGDSYTRQFDLDVTPFLLSANLLGRDVPYLNWNVACGKVYPLIGAGVGFSSLLITNFRTTGLPPTGGSAPFDSFSAENQYTKRTNFTYTAQLGFEYNYNDCWTLATGYRWLDAGKFKGPRYQRVDTGSAVDVSGEEWKMRFRSNEWFVELKIYL